MFNPILNPSCVFLYQLLFSSALFDSSLYFLTVKLFTVLIHSCSEFVEHLYDHYLELFIGIYCFHHFTCCFFWGYILFLTLEHIISPLNFAWFSVLFVCIRWVGYISHFEEVEAYRRCPVRPTNILPLVTRVYNLTLTCVCWVGPSVVVGLTTVVCW